jgi:hypothetical protein
MPCYFSFFFSWSLTSEYMFGMIAMHYIIPLCDRQSPWPGLYRNKSPILLKLTRRGIYFLYIKLMWFSFLGFFYDKQLIYIGYHAEGKAFHFFKQPPKPEGKFPSWQHSFHTHYKNINEFIRWVLVSFVVYLSILNQMLEIYLSYL